MEMLHMGNKKPAPDWERIEVEFRAGVLSLREIALANGISHVAVAKRAKKAGWERDLQAKIQAKADALVNKRAVTAEVNNKKAATEREVVEANAAQIARIRGEHRSDIGRARTLALNLLGELEAATGGAEVFRKLAEYMAAPDEKGIDKLNDAYQQGDQPAEPRGVHEGPDRGVEELGGARARGLRHRHARPAMRPTATRTA